MINLAGDSRATQIAQRELERCGIEPFEDPTYDHPEVKTKIKGRLSTPHGEFLFHRNWYYWVVTGPVPLDLAKQLYADRVGKTDIRVTGHCGCPPPESPWITWRFPNGKEVVGLKNKEDADRYAAKEEKTLRQIGEQMLKEYEFSDDPSSLGARPFIESYHIDSELGLYIFVQHVKRAD